MGLKFLVVIVLFNASSPSLALTELEISCADAKGEIRGLGCYCPKFGIYLPKDTHECPEKNLQDAGLLKNCDPAMLASSGCSHSTSVGPSGLPPSNSKIEFRDLCTHPSSFLCDQRFNPFIAKIRDASNAYDELFRKAQGSKEIQDYVQKKAPGSTQCSQLPPEDFKNCIQQINDIIQPELFTSERVDKLEALFEKAQNALIYRLQEERLLLKGSGRELSTFTLDHMIDSVKRTRIRVGPIESREKFKQTAMHRKVTIEKQQTIEVYVEASILTIDEAPESLYLTLLHEISHSISANAYLVESPLFPFKKNLACLKRNDSVGAKTGDWACFEKWSKKFEGKNAEIAQRLRSIAKDLKENPNLFLNLPPDIAETECQNSQVDEAFADWLATEAWVTEKSISLDRLANEKGTKKNAEITDLTLINKLTRYPELASSISNFCFYNELKKTLPIGSRQLDEHPLETRRIDAIFSNHPQIKFALGCPRDFVSNARTEKAEDDPVTKQKPRVPVYCGRHLNPASEKYDKSTL